MGLVLSSKKNLENVAILGRIWDWGTGGLDLGAKKYRPSICQHLLGWETLVTSDMGVTHSRTMTH